MKIKLVNKKSGYFVGFGIGNLTEKEIQIIVKLKLPAGTYKLDGMNDYLGIWVDNENILYIEKSRWFKEFFVAYKHGKKRGEKAIWDCENKRNIWLIEQKGEKLKKHVKTKQFEYWIYKEKE